MKRPMCDEALSEHSLTLLGIKKESVNGYVQGQLLNGSFLVQFDLDR